MTHPYSPHQMIGAGDRAPAGAEQHNMPMEMPEVPAHTAGTARDMETAMGHAMDRIDHGHSVVQGTTNISNAGTHSSHGGGQGDGQGHG